MSKIKLGKTGIDFIKQWVIKTALKQQPKGVLTTLPKKDFVDLNTGITAERLMRNGVDPNSIKNVDQVDNIIDQLNKPRAVAADSPEGKGITEALFGKKGEVFNLQGEKLDPSKPIVGGSQSGKKINREFFERNAEAKELQKRIESGVASTVEKILGMDPIDAMKEANKVIGRKGKYKNLSQEDAKKILNDTEDHIFQRDPVPGEFDPDIEDFQKGGRVGLKGGADAATESFTKSAGSSAKGRKGSVSVSPSGNVTFNPGGKDDPVDDRSTFEQTINQKRAIENARKDSNPIRDIIDAGSNFNYLRNLYKMNPVGIGSSFLMNRLGNILFPPAAAAEVNMEELSMEGGILNNPFMEKQVIERITEAENDYMRKTGEPPPVFMGDKIRMDMYKGAMQGYKGPGFADGGRIGLKKGMDRRTFMKIMGGLTTIPVLGKFFKGAEVAAPVAEKAIQAAKGVPPYFFDLVNKIKAFGEPRRTPSYRERVVEYQYTGKDGIEYELVEELDTGNIKITKDKIGGANYGDESFEVIEDRTEMNFVKGQGDEATRGTPADEYEEYKVEFDQDGTVADASEIDEVSKMEIIKEVTDEAPSIKKASGGIARMLGE